MCAVTDIGEAGEELQSAAAMLHSDEQGGPAIQLLSKVLGNIIASPAEPKFRCCPGLLAKRRMTGTQR